MKRLPAQELSETRGWMFAFADLPAITGMAEPRLKNWSSGRPLSVKPHKILGRSGVYTETEIWRFVVADGLVKFGIEACKSLQTILDQLTEEKVGAFGTDTDALAIALNGGAYTVQFVPGQKLPPAPECGVFILPLRPLRERILRNIHNLQERS